MIFDLDGTLVDSLEDIGDAMNATLTARGLPTHPVAAYQAMVGEGIEQLVRRALPPVCPLPIATLVAEYRGAYKATQYVKTLPYPGVIELLDALARRRFPIAVLSNKRDDFTKDVVERRFGLGRFVDVRGEREGVPRKPDPTAALDLAKLLGFSPGDVGFVGDTPIDVKTALAAGMSPIAVSWGFRSVEELTNAGAATVLFSPVELLPLLS